MNKKHLLVSMEDSPFRIMMTLISITAFWEFCIQLCLHQLNIKNNLVEVTLSAYLLASFVSFTFYFFYLLPKWKRISTEHSFIDQQITGLNEVAIISSTNKYGNIIYANDNFCRISGFSREEVLGKNHRIIKSSYHSNEFYAEMWNTISKGNIWKGQIKSRAKDGREYWVYASIIPLRNNETGKIDEYISIRFDITKEKNFELELENEQAKNIHMGRLAALGEMAGSVAHEINNPVAVIIGKLHLLRRTLDQVENKALRDSILSKMKTVEEHSKRIAKIVKGLREFSHGGDSNTFEEVDSIQLLESVFELCGEKLKNNGVKIQIKCPEIKFHSTRLQLEQVLVNLINNSIDAIAQNKEKWIEISMHETENNIHLAVKDSGNGIPDEILKKIMLPFFTTKPVGKGTGLGLSISKGLIEKLGGEFFYDRESVHTCFKISLPKNELVIFNTLDYAKVIDCLGKVSLKVDCFQTINDLEKYEGEFSLKIPECDLPEWLIKYEARLGKNPDFLELKNTYNLACAHISDIEWKYMNKNFSDEVEFARSKLQLNQSIELLKNKLIDVQARQIFQSSPPTPAALIS